MFFFAGAQALLSAVSSEQQVAGAGHVFDELSSESGASSYARGDVELQARIVAQVNRDPVIGADDVVSVNVVSGTADIGGIVDTWAVQKSVTHDAFLAGAKTVVNHLRVREDPTHSERRFVYRRPS